MDDIISDTIGRIPAYALFVYPCVSVLCVFKAAVHCHQEGWTQKQLFSLFSSYTGLK